jgi:hypothetical protein
LVWFGLVWFGLVWFGLVWFGLVWFGLVWFGLVWFGLVWDKPRDKKYVEASTIIITIIRVHVLVDNWTV